VLVAGVLLGAVTPAHAEWETKDVSGMPRDVRVWGDKLYSVTTTKGAYLFNESGLSQSTTTTQAVASRLMSTGCFVIFMKGGSLTGLGGCPPQIPPPFAGPIQLSQVRFADDGAAYALAYDTSVPEVVTSYAPSEGSTWVSQSLSGLSPMTLGVLQMGGKENALIAVGDASGVDFIWQESGAQASFYSLPSGGPPSPVLAIDLFNAGGPTPTALFAWGSELYRGPLVRGTQPQFAPLGLPISQPRTVMGVDVNTGAGGMFGDGFGMVTMQSSGGPVVLSAVPEVLPQDIGTEWQVNPTLPSGGASLAAVSCWGAKFCVLATTAQDIGNLLVYTNMYSPVIVADSDVEIPEGSPPRTIPVRTWDLDGDAVRLTLDPSSLADTRLTLSSAEVSGGVDLTVSPGMICEDTLVSVKAMATDGLAEHEVTRAVNLHLIHTRQAGPPLLNQSNNISVAAGDSAVHLHADLPTKLPCSPGNFRWTALTPNAPQLLGSGTAVDFPTPPVLCKPDGESDVYRLELLDTGGLASEPTDFTVQVRPWGPPLRPFSADKQLTLQAGDSVVLTPENTHVCDAPASGFPGVDTLWTIGNGGMPPPGVQLVTLDGTVVTNSGAVTPTLQVQTAECAAGTLQLSVKNYTRSGSNSEGPAASVSVSVDPHWLPISNGVLSLTASTVTADSVSGTASVTGLNCLAERGGVKARFRLKREDGTLVREVERLVPGAWELALGDACQGGNYFIEAQLVDDSGPQTAPVQLPVVVPPTELRLASIEPQPLIAACGQPASGTVRQPVPAGPCSALPLQWEQVGGPPLAQPSFTGQQMDVSTQETDFGALIGQMVQMRITADTGVVTQATQNIPITAEPFVTVDHRVENAAGIDTQLIGVSVTLHNTTTCGVSEMDHMERLVGADYVPGSARFNDAPVEAEMDGEQLTVHGLELQGSGTGQLTFVVRQRLLGTTRFEGQSFVRGVPVSQAPVEPPGGCGCSGGGSGFTALGLGGLVSVLRRRRGR
jgi:hypothetical protein